MTHLYLKFCVSIEWKIFYSILFIVFFFPHLIPLGKYVLWYILWRWKRWLQMLDKCEENNYKKEEDPLNLPACFFLFQHLKFYYSTIISPLLELNLTDSFPFPNTVFAFALPKIEISPLSVSTSIVTFLGSFFV